MKPVGSSRSRGLLLSLAALVCVLLMLGLPIRHHRAVVGVGWLVSAEPPARTALPLATGSCS